MYSMHVQTLLGLLHKNLFCFFISVKRDCLRDDLVYIPTYSSWSVGSQD
jgi:hypothetical protein